MKTKVADEVLNGIKAGNKFRSELKAALDYPVMKPKYDRDFMLLFWLFLLLCFGLLFGVGYLMLFHTPMLGVSIPAQPILYEVSNEPNIISTHSVEYKVVDRPYDIKHSGRADMELIDRIFGRVQ